jgi:hypothetical protein
MSGTSARNNRVAVASEEADRGQAECFRREIEQQVALLKERSDKLRDALATYERRGERMQVRRMQRELRSAAITRRELLNMLVAIDERFPVAAPAVSLPALRPAPG